MNADNSHAERQILKRAVAKYDEYRAFGYEEIKARGKAIYHFRRWAHLPYLIAAERLADALARRAADKLKGE